MKKKVDIKIAPGNSIRIAIGSASVAELVDALDSKSNDGNIVRVQVSPEAQGRKIIKLKIKN